MKKSIIKKLAKKIEAQNEEFNNMTKAQKRVVIAQDCIDRIKGEQLKAFNGDFAEVLGDCSDSSIKTGLNKDGITCQVCAKGGLFMSYIGRANEMNVRTLNKPAPRILDYSSEAMIKLAEIFTPLQLDMMEVVFEGQTYSWMILEQYSKEYNKCIEFRSKYTTKDRFGDLVIKDQDGLLIDICQNIIDNKGTFKI